MTSAISSMVSDPNKFCFRPFHLCQQTAFSVYDKPGPISASNHHPYCPLFLEAIEIHHLFHRLHHLPLPKYQLAVKSFDDQGNFAQLAGQKSLLSLHSSSQLSLMSHYSSNFANRISKLPCLDQQLHQTDYVSFLGVGSSPQAEDSSISF